MNVLRIKIALIGDSRVGKTCLVNQFIKQYFNSTYQMTLGIEYSTFDLKVKDSDYVVQFHFLDFSGFSIYRDMIYNQISDCNYIFYVFDVTSNDSYQNVKLWKESLKEYLGKFTKEVLIANKIDNEAKILIDETTTKSLANNYKIPYFCVSSLTAKNLKEMFNTIALQYIDEFNNFVSKVQSFSY